MSNISTWPISSATTLGQSRPTSNGNEGVVCFPQSTSITGALPSDCLMSYQDIRWSGGGGVLFLCRDAVGVFYSPSWLGWGGLEFFCTRFYWIRIIFVHTHSEGAYPNRSIWPFWWGSTLSWPSMTWCDIINWWGLVLTCSVASKFWVIKRAEKT